MLEKPQHDFNSVQNLMMHVQAFSALLESMRLGVFETLAAAPYTAGELAQKHGFREDATGALLEMFLAYGLVKKTADTYAASGMASEFLASGSPFYQGQNLQLHCSFVNEITKNLAAQLRGEDNGRSGVDAGWSLEDGMTGSYQDALLGPLQDTVEFISQLENFPRMRTFCDIGGNHGGFSMALLDRNPDLQGEIADLPHVAAAANTRIEQMGYADRLRAFECNLDTARLPEDRYDLILASHILYGFVDTLPELFTMLHSALKPGGWFVAQHLNPNGGLPVQYGSVVEFITCICGYKTHHIAKETLTEALSAAGFAVFKDAPAGKHHGGLIVAGQKPS